MNEKNKEEGMRNGNASPATPFPKTMSGKKEAELAPPCGKKEDIQDFVESVRNVCVWIPNSGRLANGKGDAWELRAPSLVGRALGVPTLSWGRIRKGVHGTESNATFANAKGATTLISIKLTVVLTLLSLDTGKPV